MKHEKHVGNLVTRQNKGLLGVFSQKIAQLETLTTILKANLMGPVREHCRVANLRDDCLIIMTDSAAWATQIRFLIPDLLKRFKQTTELKRVRKIEFYIEPAAENTQPSTLIKREPLSTGNIQLLNAVGNLRDDALGKALRKLAGNAASRHCEEALLRPKQSILSSRPLKMDCHALQKTKTQGSQ